jgi:hypothetical protein
MRQFLVRWPCVAVALFLAVSLSMKPALAAPIPSQLSPLISSPEAAALLERLQAMGFAPGEAQRRLNALSSAEALRLAEGADRLLIGAGEEKKVLGVAAVIIIAVAAITGFYLFYNSK